MSGSTEQIFVLDENQLDAILIPKIVTILKAQKPPFCLWLRGDLGAGKTTFAGKLLHCLGLPAKVPVLSPTFTYMTEYKIGVETIAHIDLYRLAEADNDSVATLLADRLFSGLIVEWPERCEQFEGIMPTQILDISFAEHNQRLYKLVNKFSCS